MSSSLRTSSFPIARRQACAASIWGQIRRKTRTPHNHKLDGRTRLSNIWTPLKNKAEEVAEQPTRIDAGALLETAGFIQYASKGHLNGFFHMLPFGLRVQEKLERLIDKHMRRIGASKLALSSITTRKLWEKTGRFKSNNELYEIDSGNKHHHNLLLSPTHEEEITHLLTSYQVSHKHLPLRLYQVSRKYRHEKRPRAHLLRSREFLMKDLYTFDSTEEQALATYAEAVEAYEAFFRELGVPFLVANADSGSMGGNLSHEFHFPSENGEDDVYRCNECNMTANEEILQRDVSQLVQQPDAPIVSLEFVSMDRKQMIIVELPSKISTNDPEITRPTKLNTFALKKAYPTIDLSVPYGEQSAKLWQENEEGSIVHIRDARLPDPESQMTDIPVTFDSQVDLVRIEAGDACPKCGSGHLSKEKAIEVGHTFHLGTRYSEPLKARAVLSDNTKAPMQMGCHGIGISRLIGAIASVCADEKGLRWPRIVAPFEAVIVFENKHDKMVKEGERLYDALKDHADIVIDDRAVPQGQKLREADQVGYPFVIQIAKNTADTGEVDVRLRSGGQRRHLDVDRIRELLAQETSEPF